MKSVWIARTNAVIPEEMEHFIERHPEEEIGFTKLLVLYEKPWEFKPHVDGYGKFIGARIMCEAPGYMYPEIKPGQVVEFKSDEI